MLYTVITFVALFIIAAVCAVILYVDAQDAKTKLGSQTEDMKNVASNTEAEQRNLTKVIGKKLKGKAISAPWFHISMTCSPTSPESCRRMIWLSKKR